jgi:16S rRNA (adenine1518-N6/adenine1519-N6)-dimethyltransferase
MGFYYNKQLGQNFLQDSKVAEQIVSTAGDLKDCNVIEIGPGFGILSRIILNYPIKQLISIEKDERFIALHEDLMQKYKEKYKIVNADALSVDEREITTKPVKIIANLPYNISIILLFKWIEYINFFDKLTLMFQKEVAERITSGPGSKNYGSISIIIQFLCEVKYEFTVPASLFRPQPKVNSAVISITPRTKTLAETRKETLQKITKILFNHRRKMLRVSLKQLTNSVKEVLNQVNIEATLRPEELTIEQFCSLANAIDGLDESSEIK